MTDVTVLGAGNMGAAIVRVLLANGVAVTVWNRTRERAAPLAAEGARIGATAIEALAASPLTIAILADYAAVVETFGAEPASGCGAGRTILNLTTGRPEDVAACRRVLERFGSTYLDGGISGHPQDIGRDTSQILVAGSEDAWLAHRAHIELLAGRTVYLGADVEGAASALDLAMSGCFQTLSLCAFIEAAAYVSSLGIDVDVLRPQAIRLLEKMKLQIDTLVTAMSSRAFATDQATLDVYHAALAQVSSSMASAGVRGRMTDAATANMADAEADGRGQDGLGVQFEYLKNSG